MVVGAVVRFHFPFSIVRQKKFRLLVTYGEGRHSFCFPNGETIKKFILVLRQPLEYKLRACIVDSISALSIAFVIWSYRNSRRFLAITGHFYSKDMVLMAPLLDIMHLPKTTEGHTADRIFLDVRNSVKHLIGDTWSSRIRWCLTDGTANVCAAS